MLDYKALAAEWIESWNKRDMEGIMKHYADDVEFYSPTVIKRWNIADGKINGKEKLQQHFLKAFEEVPNLHFEIIAVAEEKEGVTITYKTETGQIISDYIVMDKNGKCLLVKAYAR